MIETGRRLQVFHGRRYVWARGWKARLAQIGIAEDDRWIDLEPGELMSRSPATRSFRVGLPDGETVYFKRYVYTPRYWLEFWLRPGKAAVEVFGLARLSALGIEAPEVVALGEKRWLGMLLATFLVTREVRDARGLVDFAEERLMPARGTERRAVFLMVARPLVEQLRRAHAARFFHHDLKWRNILIREDAAGVVPVWIDCPRGDVKRIRWRRGVVGDLSALARVALSLCTVRERWRFLRMYCGPHATRGQIKALWGRVAAHLARRPPRAVPADPQRPGSPRSESRVADAPDTISITSDRESIE